MREDFMEIHDDRPPDDFETSNETDFLLWYRMAMLGLDLHAIESHAGETVDKIRRRCNNCDDREACDVDLKRDPNSPVWTAYCPNCKALNSLTEVWW